MNIKKSSQKITPVWFRKCSADNNIIISSRIRLARNFSDLRFPAEASLEEKEQVLARVKGFSEQYKSNRFKFMLLKNNGAISRLVLAELGLISVSSVSKPNKLGLLTQTNRQLSLLLNEEDHLRIQVMSEGGNLEPALNLAKTLDKELNKKFTLACHPDFDFLTACPTNVGTGLRASVMFHLPALSLKRKIAEVLQAVLQMGLAVRGFYGEGTELRSVFFQISNQMTLGRSEMEIIKHLQGLTKQILDREKDAREKLLKEDKCRLEDKVGRAIGILKGCKMLNLEEAFDLLSTVILGVETGVLKKISRQKLRETLLLIQPAHLQLWVGEELNFEDQMLKRAEIISQHLNLYK